MATIGSTPILSNLVFIFLLYKMLDKNKQQLKAWDLFKFTDWGSLIYEAFSKWDKLLFKGYSFESKQDFDSWNLSDFKFEIVGTAKDWLDERSYDYIKRERLKRGERFLDS